MIGFFISVLLNNSIINIRICILIEKIELVVYIACSILFIILVLSASDILTVILLISFIFNTVASLMFISFCNREIEFRIRQAKVEPLKTVAIESETKIDQLRNNYVDSETLVLQ
jgi:hypothetical protein